MRNSTVRRATYADVEDILHIYNQGIEDRIVALEEETKDRPFINNWFDEHQGSFAILVAENDGKPTDVMIMEKLLV